MRCLTAVAAAAVGVAPKLRSHMCLAQRPVPNGWSACSTRWLQVLRHGHQHYYNYQPPPLAAELRTTFLEPQNGSFWVGCVYGRNDDAARFAWFCGAAAEFLRTSEHR